MTEPTRKIIGIYGPEPMREGEIPDGARVGYSLVDRIEAREQNLGTYGIQWLDVYSGERVVQSFNSLHIASIIYEKE